MGKYIYSAMKNRQTVSGEIEAADQKMAAIQIRRMGLLPISVSSAENTDFFLKNRKKSRALFGSRKVKQKDITRFSRQLSTLLSSGLPLSKALNFSFRQTDNPGMKKIISSISDQIGAGASLSNTLKQFPELFNHSYLSMISAGESAGILCDVLERIAFMRESAEEVRARIKSAMIYPAFMLTAMIGAIGILMGFVVPRFAMLFSDMGQTLPFPTRILMSCSGFIASWWWVVPIIGAAGFAGYRQYCLNEENRHKIDRMKLEMPVTGHFLHIAAMTRFCRTFGTLLESGVPVLQALSSASGVTGNLAVQQASQKVIQEVRHGQKVSSAMTSTGLFNDYVVEMAGLGEKSATLGSVMVRVAEAYDKELDQLVKSLTSLIEPIIILIMGGFTGFIVMAMLLPIFQMNIMAG
jgi:type II secretory pathway component PulF